MAKKRKKSQLCISKCYSGEQYSNEWKEIAKLEPLHSTSFPDVMSEMIGSACEMREKVNVIKSFYLRASQQYERNEPINTECTEFAFAGHFLYGNICAQEDFLMILTDFNVKKGNRFEEFLQYVPMLDRANSNSKIMSPDNFTRQEIIGLLYGGVKAGDMYCREALRMLYKTFYKSEYNQLKRFSVIRSAELIDLCKDDEKMSIELFKASRVLCMSYVMGIQVDESCRPLYIAIEDMITMMEEKSRAENALISKVIEDNHLREELQNSPRVDEILKQTPQDSEGNYLTFDKVNSVISRMFSDQGDFAEDYLRQSFPIHITHAVEYLNAIISDMGLSNKFSNEDIMLLTPFVAVISSYAILDEEYKNLLYSFLYPNLNLEANPSQIVSSLERLKLTDVVVHKEFAIDKIPAEETTESEPQRDSLEDEITELRRRLREKESECIELRAQYKKEREAKKELELELSEHQSERIELQKLRDYVYCETEEDVAEKRVSYEEMKLSLQNRNVIIIGGNENWTKKLKNEFPNWKFVKAVVSSTVTSNIIKNCEKVYFFTDTLGHSNYAKFVDLARIHGIDFSYMHGVNMQKNVEQIYRDFEK